MGMWEQKMKKALTLLLVFLCSASLLLTFSSSGTVQAQSSVAKVVTYSWYKSVWSGNLIVVGELQNTGPDLLSNVVLTGIAYTVDGEAQATQAYSIIYTAGELMPNQIAPFFMEFNPSESVWGNMSWIELGIDRIDFRTIPTKSNATTSSMYSDVRLISPANYIDSAGNYTVTGIVFNYGTGYPESVWVVGSFYDAAGKVVAVGYSNFVDPHYLAPNEYAQFSLKPTEPTAAMASQIASYNLTVLTKGSTTQPTPGPSISVAPTGTASPTGSPTNEPTNSEEPQSSPDGGDSGIPTRYLFAIVAAVVVVVAVIVVAVLLRRNRTAQ
jgi:hypothetical protein